MARSPAKRVIGSLLFIIALLVMLAFYFVLFADAERLDSIPGTDMIPELAIGLAIVLGIVALILILLMVIGGWQKKEEDTEDAEAFFIPEEETYEESAEEDWPEPVEEEWDEPEAYDEPAPEPEEGDLTVYDIWRLPVAHKSWGEATADGMTHTFYFPGSIEAGVYVNDYIALDKGGRKLKLRTLLAGPTDFGMPDFAMPEHEPAEDHVFEEVEPEAPIDAPRLTEAKPRASDHFMAELESRYEERKKAPARAAKPAAPKAKPAAAAPAKADSELYYDYTGDNHQVIDVEGIGPKYAKKLNNVGIETTARLCYEEASKIAKKIDAPAKTVHTWQSMAELMKVSGIGPQYAEVLARAGIDGIQALKRRSASRMAKEINDYLDSLESNIIGSGITEKRVEGWQKAAKDMRRVRLAIPDA